MLLNLSMFSLSSLTFLNADGCQDIYERAEAEGVQEDEKADISY